MDNQKKSVAFLDRSLEIAYGAALQAFLVNEMLALNSYQTHDWHFSYLRTKDDAEIDLVIERPGLPLALVEIKSTRQVLPKHVATLNRLAPEFGRCECFCLSRDPAEKRVGVTHVLPWEKGLTELGLRLANINSDLPSLNLSAMINTVC